MELVEPQLEELVEVLLSELEELQVVEPVEVQVLLANNRVDYMHIVQEMVLTVLQE